MTSVRGKRPPIPRALYALIDKHGELASTYERKSDADADAWGPRFTTYEIRRYNLIAKGGGRKAK